MNILDLREKYLDRLVPIEDCFKTAQKLHIHNFSFGTGVGYFEILKYVPDPSIFVTFDFGWVMFRRGRWIAFALSLEGGNIFQELTGKKTVHLVTDSRPKYWGLLDETTYDPSQILIPENYRHTELRRKVLRQPFTQLQDRLTRVEMREEGMFQIAKAINKEWAEVKRGDPGLHQNSFPSGRYANLWPRLLEAEKLYPGMFEIYAHMYYIDGEPFGFKIGTIEDGCYHLASSESKFWLPHATKTSTWLNTLFFDQLIKDRPDVHTINFGLAFDKGLRRWKAQWPHTSLNHYQLTFKE